MDDFGDMFGNQDEIGEPGEHGLGGDMAGAPYGGDDKAPELGNWKSGGDRSPLEQTLNAVKSAGPDPTTFS